MQRSMVFFRENESALLFHKNDQGPAQFNLAGKKVVSNFINEPKFSIPQVSAHFN
jgi:hypothetical protein